MKLTTWEWGEIWQYSDPDSNRVPLDSQSNALPLRHTAPLPLPYIVCLCETPYICGHVIVEHTILVWVARVMLFRNTLYGWLYYCGTPCMGCYVIEEHPIWVAMSLWNTLYGWPCHCGTPCMGGYIIVEHPVRVAMSLRNTLYGWLCHCWTPYLDGCAIVEHPIWVTMSL